MLVPCSCGKRLRVPDSLQGKRIKCPGCGSSLVATPVEAGVSPANRPVSPSATASVQMSWKLLILTGLLGAFAVGNLGVMGVFLFFGITASAKTGGPSAAAPPLVEPIAPAPPPPLPEPKVAPEPNPVVEPQPTPEPDPKPEPKPDPEPNPASDGTKVGQLWCQVHVEGHRISVSPDGRRLLTLASHDVRLYDLERGRLVHPFDPDSRPAFSVEFVGNRQFIVGHNDGSMDLIDAESHQRVRSFESKPDRPRTLAVSRGTTPRAFTTGFPDAAAIEWDTATGTERRRSEKPADQPTWIACSANGNRAVVVIGSCPYVWDTEKGTSLRPLGITAQGRFLGLALSDDGKRALLAGISQVYVWDVEGDRPIAHFDLPKRPTAVAFSADGRRALVGSGGASGPADDDDQSFVWLFDVDQKRKLHEFRGHRGDLRAVAFTPDGKRAVSLALDSTLRLWQLPDFVATPVTNPDPTPDPTTKPPFVARGPVGQLHRLDKVDVPTLHISADGRRAIGVLPKQLVLFDLDNGRLLRMLGADNRELLSAGFVTDARECLVSRGDGTMEVVDVDAGKTTKFINGKSSMPRFMQINNNGQLAFTAGQPDRCVIQWDLKAGKELKRSADLPESAQRLSASANGQRVLADVAGTTFLWDSAAGTQLRTLKVPQGGNAVLSHDGKRAVVLLKDHVCIWDVDADRERARFKPAKQPVIASFSPDDRRLLVGSFADTKAEASPEAKKGLIWLYDADTQRQVHEFEGHAGSIIYLGITPDGGRAVSLATDLTLRIWQLPTPR